MKNIAIGTMPQDEIRERMYAIARGEYKPAPGEPKVWFISQESMAEVLNDDSSALRRAIDLKALIDEGRA